MAELSKEATDKLIDECINVLNNLAYTEGCGCENSINNPMVPDHTKLCHRANNLMNRLLNNKKKGRREGGE